MAPAKPESQHTWRTEVIGVSSVKDLDRFKAVLLRNGVLVDVLDSLMDTSDSIDFIDLDARGTLTPGDIFTIECIPDSVYRLSIVWKDSGNVKGDVEWVTGSPVTNPHD
jgi:hypothetical protein